MENVKIAELIRKGETVLGMEFGSTRIKAVLIDTSGNPLGFRKPWMGEPSGKPDLDLQPDRY